MLKSRKVSWGTAVLLVVVGVISGLLIPVTTRQGVDFVVSAHRLPLYVKALDFVDRDVNSAALARKITAGKTTDEARALTVFEWTRANIRDVPPGFPIVDDHVWNIIIRGYGLADQKADVFTTLATYGGVRAYWIWLDHDGERLPVSFALIEGRWRVVDVEHGFVFRNRQGELATLDELGAEPSLVRALAGSRIYHGRPYASYFASLATPSAPDVLRAEKQMLWPRALFEAKRLVGLGSRQGDTAPILGRPTAER